MFLMLPQLSFMATLHRPYQALSSYSTITIYLPDGYTCLDVHRTGLKGIFSCAFLCRSRQCRKVSNYWVLTHKGEEPSLTGNGRMRTTCVFIPWSQVPRQCRDWTKLTTFVGELIPAASQIYCKFRVDNPSTALPVTDAANTWSARMSIADRNGEV